VLYIYIRKHNEEHVSSYVRPYDWTFSTNYKGTVNSETETTDEEIDIKELQKPDPILFYDSMVLFEDEMDDNGATMLSLKVVPCYAYSFPKRVMPTCFLVLLRFFLRVDGLLFRIRDTRLFHKFTTNYLIREYSEMEQDYHTIKQVND
jgi:type 2A phosphatase activator TIP41